MPVNQKPLGVRLQERREALSLSREDVAKAFGVSVVSVRNWERGLNTPRKFMLLRLEKFAAGGRLPRAEASV
jgi:transcriptional regulator with XRE-family HTH domain